MLRSPAVPLAALLALHAVACGADDPTRTPAEDVALDAGADTDVPDTDPLDADVVDADTAVDAADASPDAAAPMLCNGHAELCDRPFDQLVLAGTHNAMSNAEDGFLGPNHNLNIAHQLQSGIRAMLIDTYRDGDALLLCHGNCVFGRSDAIEQLGSIASFLADHPNDVMAFVFEDHVDMDDSIAMLEASGLAALALTPPADGEPWPTVAEMIEAGTRVLLTHESGREGPPWFPRAWDVMLDTPYSFEAVEDFSCRENRGDASRPLRLLNHWLGAPLSLPALAEQANAVDVLGARADACADAWGQRANIIAVDYSDIGDLFDVVDQQNGVATAE